MSTAIKAVKHPQFKTARRIAVCEQNNMIAIGSLNGALRDLHSMFFENIEVHGLHVTSVSFSPNGRQCAAGSWDRTVRG